MWVWPCVGVAFHTHYFIVPVRVSMCLAPRHGNRLVSWSLEKFIPLMSSANGVGDCYFVFYARGFGEGKFSFWLELKVQKWTVDVMVVMWCESLGPGGIQ